MKAVPSDTRLILRRLGIQPYAETWRAMQQFTAGRGADTPDELWLLEHPPVFTMGLRGHARASEHIGGIPVVCTDRGGDITYHGPGQPVLYVLVDLARRDLGIRELVALLEDSAIRVLRDAGVTATRRPGAPGVYVGNHKIASLGLRVRQGRSYHGISLNVAMDLVPFSLIRPCGLDGVGVTELSLYAPEQSPDVAGATLARRVAEAMGYHDLVEVESH